MKVILTESQLKKMITAILEEDADDLNVNQEQLQGVPQSQPQPQQTTDQANQAVVGQQDHGQNNRQGFLQGAQAGEMSKDNKRSQWINAVKIMGNWYQDNVTTYCSRPLPFPAKLGKRRDYKCPLIGKYVQDDCSSFVKACLELFGIKEISRITVNTTALNPIDGVARKILQANGFKCLPFNKAQPLQPGDILLRCAGNGRHTEIYAGGGKVYSWGAVHNRKEDGTPGLPCNMANKEYQYVYRLLGNEQQTFPQKPVSQGQRPTPIPITQGQNYNIKPSLLSLGNQANAIQITRPQA